MNLASPWLDHAAKINPGIAPPIARITDSAIDNLARRQRLAPRAARRAYSGVRLCARARATLARLTHASKRRMATIPVRMKRGRVKRWRRYEIPWAAGSTLIRRLRNDARSDPPSAANSARTEGQTASIR